MNKFLFALTLLSALSTPTFANEPSPPLERLSLLQASDVNDAQCGTFIHDIEVESPTLTDSRLFMDTDYNLYVRPGQEVRKLELARMEPQLKDENAPGAGDVLTFYFEGEAKERAVLKGTLTEVVYDEQGNYPIIEMDMSASYTNANGETVTHELYAHDWCL